MGCAHGGESVAGRVGFGFGEREEEVLGGDEVVLEGVGLLGGAVEDLLQGGGHGGLGVGAGDFGELRDGGVGPGQKLLHTDARALEDGEDDALAVFQQGGEQVHGQDFGVAVLGGEGRGGLDGLLRFDGQLFPLEWHDTSFDADGLRADMAGASRPVERNLELVYGARRPIQIKQRKCRGPSTSFRMSRVVVQDDAGWGAVDLRQAAWWLAAQAAEYTPGRTKISDPESMQ